jgi:molybdopterin/thiamine biosynthesis adenylyltransferase
MSTLEELNRTILLCRDYVVEGLTDEEICRRFQSLQVLCVSDLRNISSHSGQTALVTLLSLLGRMGMQVGLAIPEVAMLSPQPPLSGSLLCKALTASSGTLVTGATVRRDSDFNPDLVFVLGDTRVDNGGHASSWRLSGSDWHGVLAMEGTAEARAWTPKWPVGSMVSAALAANEAFKFVMRQLPLRDRSDAIFFQPSRACSWSFESIPVAEQDVHIGQVDLISAGAITQAALYALMRFPRIEMWGRVFDDDLTGVSNLNRNMLTLATDVGSPKVRVVAQSCAPKLQLEPLAKRFAGKILNRKLARRVLVGVDDIPSRWDVQRNAPGWVAVSGTSHFNVSSSAHSPAEPCSGCLHPVDDSAGANPIPTVSFVSFWAGLAMAVRLLREALSSPYSLNRQHLWLTPLRMDLPHAAMWLPVASRRDCPVRCSASQAL